MWTLARHLVAAALLAVVGLSLVSPAAAAPPQRLNPNGATVIPNPQRINPNWLVAPGVTLRQWMYNTQVQANAYASIPPYMLGYNPYAQFSYYGMGNPYIVNPYLQYPSLYNPYAGMYTANPYNPYGLYGYSYLFQ